MTLFVEGIGTTPGWGTAKIEARLYPTTANPALFVSDRVSYTVVRCVYKICVYRPYVCVRDGEGGAGAIVERDIFRADYGSPITMMQTYFTGMKGFDNASIPEFHQTAASMGHAFARLEVRTPSVPSLNYWTGQTGLNGAWQALKSMSAFQQGEAWWFRASDGEEDDPDKDGARYEDLYRSPIPESDLHETNQPSRKMLAVREFRILPQTAALLNEYRMTHPFSGYGLDSTLRTSTDSRVGCGSYIGWLTEYAGVTDIAPWTQDLMMPVIDMDLDITYTDVWLAARYGSYLLGWNAYYWSGLDALQQQAMPSFMDHDEAWEWGAVPEIPPYRELKFCDPTKIMVWVDGENASTPHDKESGVTVMYNETVEDDLNEWRDRL